MTISPSGEHAAASRRDLDHRRRRQRPRHLLNRLHEISTEPTVVVVPGFASEPDTGFGVDVGDGWAAPGLVTSLRKARLGQLRRQVDLQVLTDVNNMLFRILATPDR